MKHDPCGFTRAIDTGAVAKLTPKQLDKVSAILAKMDKPKGKQ